MFVYLLICLYFIILLYKRRWPSSSDHSGFNGTLFKVDDHMYPEKKFCIRSSSSKSQFKNVCIIMMICFSVYIYYLWIAFCACQSVVDRACPDLQRSRTTLVWEYLQWCCCNTVCMNKTWCKPYLAVISCSYFHRI